MTLQHPAHVFRPTGIGSVNEATGPAGSWLFRRAKRGVDVVVSLALVPVLGAVILVLIVLNPVCNPGPLFFRQTRMGQNCRPFETLKLRSMRPTGIGSSRGPGDPPETDRIPPLGAFLRRTRIDELPQVFNVLRGEMSLIGPRPDAYSHAIFYCASVPGYRARHAVRPGISGLAQVTLGYAVGVEATREKTAADLAYLRDASPALEAWIFWRTLVTVAQRRGL